MARRGSGSSIMLAFLAAAGAAAAQLGLAYGLGILVWTPRGDDQADAAWAAGLAWTVFIAAVAVVVGASVGIRLGGSVYSGRVSRAAGQLTVALAAALGACVTVPLVAVATERVEVVDTFAPNLLAGIYAAAGVVVGLVIATIGLGSRAVGTNVMATAVFIWSVAVVARSTGDPQAEVTQLGIWRFTELGPRWGSFYIPGALLMLGGALLIGGLAALPSAGRGASRLMVTISGLTGPAVVAAAYALAAPRPGHATFEQLSAFYTAPYMVAAGALGAGLVAAAGSTPTRKTVGTTTPHPTSPAPAGSPAHPGAAVGTAQPVPASRVSPSAGRRPDPLPAPSPGAVTAKASVPAKSRVYPEENHRQR